VSAPFALPKHAPEPRVFGVRGGEVLPYGQALRLRGLALDAEEGSAHLAQSWRLTGPQTLTATGSAFTAFSLLPGNYTAAYTARDSDGQSNTLSRAFEVGPVTIPEAPDRPGARWVRQRRRLRLRGQCGDAGSRRPVPGPARACGRESLCLLRQSPICGFARSQHHRRMRVDVNANGGGQAGSGDVGFFVDEDGVPFQEVAQGAT